MFIKKTTLNHMREHNSRLADKAIKQGAAIDRLIAENNRLRERIAELESLCERHDVYPHNEFTTNTELDRALLYVKDALEESGEGI